MPLPSAVVVPSLTPSMKTSTVLLASAVPVSVGVVSLVMLSVLEEPVSLPAARSGVPGAAGAVVSIVHESVASAAARLSWLSITPEPAAVKVSR